MMKIVALTRARRSVDENATSRNAEESLREMSHTATASQGTGKSRMQRRKSRQRNVSQGIGIPARESRRLFSLTLMNT